MISSSVLEVTWQNGAWGACCACGKTGRTVRNIMMLDQKAPEAGTGWGCVVCHIPNDGAVAVVCDSCLEENRKILYACKGVPYKGERIAIAELRGEHSHRMELHKCSGLM